MRFSHLLLAALATFTGYNIQHVDAHAKMVAPVPWNIQPSKTQICGTAAANAVPSKYTVATIDPTKLMTVSWAVVIADGVGPLTATIDPAAKANPTLADFSVKLTSVGANNPSSTAANVNPYKITFQIPAGTKSTNADGTLTLRVTSTSNWVACATIKLSADNGGTTVVVPPVLPPPGAVTQKYTAAQVGTHNTAGNCWTIINNNVYDITRWCVAGKHPGGQVITQSCGKDASTTFKNNHGRAADYLNSKLGTDRIGALGTADPVTQAPVVTQAPTPTTNAPVVTQAPATQAPATDAPATATKKPDTPTSTPPDIYIPATTTAPAATQAPPTYTGTPTNDPYLLSLGGQGYIDGLLGYPQTASFATSAASDNQCVVPTDLKTCTLINGRNVQILGSDYQSVDKQAAEDIQQAINNAGLMLTGTAPGCLQAYTEFVCAQAFPACGSKSTSVCQSSCLRVNTYCKPNPAPQVDAYGMVTTHASLYNCTNPNLGFMSPVSDSTGNCPSVIDGSRVQSAGANSNDATTMTSTSTVILAIVASITAAMARV